MTPRTHGTSDDRSRQRTDTATHAGAPATDLTRRLIEKVLAEEEDHANDMHDLLVAHQGKPMLEH